MFNEKIFMVLPLKLWATNKKILKMRENYLVCKHFIVIEIYEFSSFNRYDSFKYVKSIFSTDQGIE